MRDSIVTFPQSPPIIGDEGFVILMTFPVVIVVVVNEGAVEDTYKVGPEG